MQSTFISHADFLETLFEGRNKEYGAYDLRKNYNHRLLQALCLTGSICVLFCIGYLIKGRIHKGLGMQNNSDSALILNIINLKKNIEIRVPANKIQFKKTETSTITKPRIIKDMPLTLQKQLADVNNSSEEPTGSTQQEGKTHDGMEGLPPSSGKGLVQSLRNDSIAEAPDSEIEETESSYIGGMDAWKKFLLKNFHPPEEAVNNGLQGTILVEFIVDTLGNVSEVRAISGPSEFRQEAERVIKKSGRWNPAI